MDHLGQFGFFAYCKEYVLFCDTACSSFLSEGILLLRVLNFFHRNDLLERFNRKWVGV